MKQQDKKEHKWLEQAINQELDSIHFKEASKKRVIDTVMMEEKRGWLHGILNYEIKISVTPIIAMGLVIFMGIGYITYPVIKVDEQDIINSQIKVIQLAEGR